MPIDFPTPKLRVDVHQGVARLLIDNGAKRNAFDLDMWRALPPLMAAIDADAEVRVVVVSGAPGLPFCSGADISEFSTVRATSAGGRAYEQANVEAFDAISRLFPADHRRDFGLLHGRRHGTRRRLRSARRGGRNGFRHSCGAARSRLSALGHALCRGGGGRATGVRDVLHRPPPDHGGGAGGRIPLAPSGAGDVSRRR